MGRLTHIQTLTGTWLSAMSQSVTLSLQGASVTLYDVSSRVENTLDLDGGPLAAGDIDTGERSAGATVAFEIEGRDHRLDRAELARLAQTETDTDTDASAYLDGVGFYGLQTLMHSFTMDAQTYLLAARPAGAGLSSYTLSDTGLPDLIQTVDDTNTKALAGLSALTTLEMGGQTWVITASGLENGISSFEVREDGQLRYASGFGFDDKLPVTQPSALHVVDTSDGPLILLGGAVTGSLSVLSLDANGAFGFVDQVNDTRDTRFDAVTAVTSHSVGDIHLVAVGGTDGGVSLFQLLPGGRLIHRETLVDGLDTGLADITQMEFVDTGAGIELVVLSVRDQAVTRFALDADSFGITATGQDGSARDDVLQAGSGGGALRANAGDDVLRDGAGADDLYGGEGADVFMFAADDTRDIIRDFDKHADTIDLSSYTQVKSIDDLELRAVSGGVRAFIGSEELRILTDDGSTLEAEDLQDSFVFADGRVIIPDAVPQEGTDASEVFESGPHADTIDGGRGYDTLSFARATEAVTVNLADNSANARAAEGYVLNAIEGITGSDFHDQITGDDRANALVGLEGRDVIDGGAGGDWITPGLGNDTVTGGDGTDMVSFIDLPRGVIVNLAEGTALSGQHTNILHTVENVTGTIYADFIQGDAGNNLLRGMGHYDWLVGSDGQDTIDGGSGRDMISYIYADARVVVDLGAGEGLEGQAAGDTYIDMERVTGSIFPDLFYGGDEAEDFRGMGGYDWFVGSGGGRDRYDGGSGLDTVSYAASDAGIVASLLLGYGSGGDAARDLYTSIENLGGTSFDDILTGDNGRNIMRGLYGEDTITANGGNDRLYGGGSNDTLDGGSGWDVAQYDGARSDYTITTVGRITTVDRIASGGEGTDTLRNIEALQFSDGYVYL